MQVCHAPLGAGSHALILGRDPHVSPLHRTAITDAQADPLVAAVYRYSK